ncbi:hypothetical protein HWV62_43846 [Athelia sp. TMB]|nr:hypothetical protein HWV62_43846 [Athelia sp. TMB]
MHEESEKPDRNTYKVIAFKSAIRVFKQLDHPLSSIEEAKNLKGVGAGIAKRIEEHFFAGNDPLPESLPAPSEKERREENQRRNAIELLQTVSGVGAVKARNLVAAGCMSLSDMAEPRYYDTLTPAQKIGLRFVDQISEPITRDQAETVLDFVRQNISAKFEIQLGGSYRRGAQESGDIDIVLFHPLHVHLPTPTILPPSKLTRKAILSGANSHVKSARMTKAEQEASPLFQGVVKPLQQRGLVAATLSTGTKKWQGVIRLPEKEEDGSWGERTNRIKAIEANEGVFRRMDLKLADLYLTVAFSANRFLICSLVASKSRGAALLALTGDTEFNKDIRMKAHSLGMHLNEFGLWRWQSNGSGVDALSAETEVGYWELVKADTEEDILAELGMEWIEPNKRNFSFVLGKTKTAK